MESGTAALSQNWQRACCMIAKIKQRSLLIRTAILIQMSAQPYSSCPGWDITTKGWNSSTMLPASDPIFTSKLGVSWSNLRIFFPNGLKLNHQRSQPCVFKQNANNISQGFGRCGAECLGEVRGHKSCFFGFRELRSFGKTAGDMYDPVGPY